jgi:serine/threonine protein kinase
MFIDLKQWPVLSKLLDEALDLPPEDRDRWLESLPQEASAHKHELRSLLRHATAVRTRDFLDVLPSLDEVAASAGAVARVVTLTPGTAVGPYVIEREIGSGGMGSVWLARRSDGVIKRPVALKLPHAGPLSRQLAERFASERNILAELAHPNIARLYDAGFSADGQPYLALEYVRGAPLTAYCDEHRLDLCQRLRLFQQVLRAVQYAHGNLVVHRDIKPTNVIVGPDRRAILLDFGIAKLIAADASDDSPRTQGAPELGLTPEYASPEQIAGQAITTASDIYSLGVLLFELLTGECPYRLGRTTRAALEEAILTVGPHRPSHSILRESSAGARGSTVRSLSRALRGDLDTIVLKALKKSPAHRYATAEALSEDIERYLAGEPIAARKDGGWYHVRKFVTRHRVPVLCAGVALVAVLATAAIAVYQAHSAAVHARAAAAERDRALALSSRNAAVGEFLHLLITEAAKSDRPVSVRDLVTRSEEIVSREYRNSPEDRAAVLEVLSAYYDTRQEYARAEELLRQALQIVKSSPDGDLRRKLTCAHAATIAKVGREAEAVRVLNSVLQDPQITQEQSARCLIHLSRIAQADGDGPNALKFAQLAWQHLGQVIPRPPVVLEADFLADLGVAHYLNGYNDAAGQYYEQALDKLARAGLERGAEALIMRNNWSMASWGAGQPRVALALMDERLRLGAQTEPDVPPEPTVLYNRAVFLDALGRYAESRESFLRCAAESRRTGVSESTAVCFLGVATVSLDLADPVSAANYLAAAAANVGSASADSYTMIKLRTARASLELAQGRFEQARADLDAAIAASKSRYLAMYALLIRAEVNLSDGKVAGAEADARRVLDLARSTQGSKRYSYHTGLASLVLGRVLAKQGDEVGAHKAFRWAVDNLSNTVDPAHPKLLMARALAGT